MNNQIKCNALLEQLQHHCNALDSQKGFVCKLEQKTASNQGSVLITIDDIEVLNRAFALSEPFSIEGVLSKVKTYIVLPANPVHKEVEPFLGVQHG